MYKKLVLSLLLWCIGGMLVRVNVVGYNPIGIGYVAAVVSGSLVNWPLIPIAIASMFTYWGFMTSVKFSLVIIAIWFIISIGKDKRNGSNEVFGAVIGAVMYGAMEMADLVMSQKNPVDYGTFALVILLTFSSSIVAGRIIEAINISGRKMQKKYNNKEKTENNIYEHKIRMIASAFDRISNSIAGISHEVSEDTMSVNCISGVDFPMEEAGSRINIVNNIWRGRLKESRDAIVLQLKEMSKILKDSMNSSYVFVPIDENTERYIKMKLKNIGISVKKIVMLSGKRGINEINITLRAVRGKNVTLGQLENSLSACMSRKYRLSRDMGNMVKGEYITYNFSEAPGYFVLHGVARCGKDGDKVSGDNFTCMELKTGQALLSVSDGMGHGTKAYKESEMVLSLLEDLMEGGFQSETALKLINSVFMIDMTGINPASVDMVVLDLYSGICEFMKTGASMSFIKRRGWVEAIRANSMPIGSELNVDVDTTTKKLYDGDFVILMSDGVVDAIEREDKEAYISELLMDIRTTNPGEMAREIMDRIKCENYSEYTDDMLVLVAGLWEKCA